MEQSSSSSGTHKVQAHAHIVFALQYEKRKGNKPSMASTSGRSSLCALTDRIAIRPEQIAREETSLRLYPTANTQSAHDYVIKDLATDSTVFTITGKKYGVSPGREFRDSTGLPLFELRRAGLFRRRPWTVRLPGGSEHDLISLRTRGPSRTVILEIAQHQTAGTSKAQSEGVGKTVALHVHRTTALYTFDVLAGDQKVATVRENTQLNKSVGHFPTGPYDHVPARRILDIELATGLDMSIVGNMAGYNFVDSQRG